MKNQVTNPNPNPNPNSNPPEMMAFSLSKTGKSHLEKGVINVEEDSSALVKYTFSDAISLSVKLGVWEVGIVSFRILGT